jgi:hypothetical protein
MNHTVGQGEEVVSLAGLGGRHWTRSLLFDSKGEVCHSKIELPFSCEQCHGPGAKLRPADHPPEFLESHSRPEAKFDKTTCALCHGRKFRCLGCH